MRALARFLVSAVFVAAALTGVIGQVSADQGDAACRQFILELYIASVGEEGTRGDAISDGFYGNEPNMADGSTGGPSEQEPGTNGGNVLPSQSPGPKVTLPDGSVVQGSSWGDFQQAIKDFCG
jgi:hypothetical protein